MPTRKTKQNPVSKPPTPSQGGHHWVKGTWCSKCSYGCGAFSEENESGEPVTEPLHMCPSNPMARGRFRLISPAPKPSSPL